MRSLKITQTLTPRDSIVTEKYLTEVSKERMVTKEEESELARRIRDGDEQALNTLVKANLRFAFSVAKQYQNSGVPLNDLVSEANIGLMKAARRFDETRGFKFISFAVWWIRQSIMESISNNSRMVRLPMNKVGVLNKYSKAFSQLEQALGRTPTQDEIAAYLGVDSTELAAVEAQMFKHTSLDATMNEGEDATMADMIQDESLGAPTDRLIRHSLMVDIERAFSVLTASEKNVLKNFFGLGCQSISLEEIALNMGCTKERVRQVKSKAVKKLKSDKRNDFLKKYM